VLSGLVPRFHTVAAISGRPVDFLAQHLPSSMVLSGVYGLESRRDGRVAEHPDVAAWRAIVADVVAEAEASGPAGMRVEPKGASLTVHYRGRPDLAPAVIAWAQDVGSRTGLEPRPAKRSVELHPPLGIDKGTVATELADGLDAVLYAGDDLGDLKAFGALDALEAAGRAVARIAVAGAETDPSLLDRADLVVDSPDALVALLRTL
jgi:trehalose 6-phosphate phosphatase